MKNLFRIVKNLIKKKESITLTKAEIDALDKHSKRARRAAVNSALADVEDLLQERYRLEDEWASMCKDEGDRAKFLYGRNLCEKLIIDVQNMRRNI